MAIIVDLGTIAVLLWQNTVQNGGLLGTRGRHSELAELAAVPRKLSAPEKRLVLFSQEARRFHLQKRTFPAMKFGSTAPKSAMAVNI